jgi:anaerobic selenocysteine-containing dehydrogenase
VTRYRESCKVSFTDITELPAEFGVALGHAAQPSSREAAAMNAQAQEQQDETTCPFCTGIASVRAVSIDGPIKFLTYVCESCQRSWNGAERWADQTKGCSTEPPMIREACPSAQSPPVVLKPKKDRRQSARPFKTRE